MDYQPDDWVVIKLGGDTYKVLGGWSGGYLGADHWRLNSGITKLSMEGDFYLFDGYSGSRYRCHEKRYGFSSLTSQIYSHLQGLADVEVVEFDAIDGVDYVDNTTEG